MNLDERIIRAVKEMGYEEATPIQAQSIPSLQEGKDVIGQAQTGTGKTAAFAIPVLQRIDPAVRKTQAIILCPTRELAIQVAGEVRKLAWFMHGVKVLPIYGGQDINSQIRSLKGGVQIIVGTPGRLMDHLRRHTIKTDEVHTVVLDEADEMLNMGFREDMETILGQVPKERQTVMFSATMPSAIREIAETFMDEPSLIKVVKKELTVQNIEQFYYEVSPANKEQVLARLLDMYSPKRSVVFCNTKRMVDELVNNLKGRGYFAGAIHGDMKQEQRDRMMKGFRENKVEILIATDVAARGIDIEDVEAVFNYDLPQDEEYYVHRIGRTGRAGKKGVAFSLVIGREVYKLKEIERYCKTKVHLRPIPSSNDVVELKTHTILRQMKEQLENQHSELDRFRLAIEEHINIEDYTALDLAAVFLKQAIGNNVLEEIIVRPARRPRRERGGRSEEREEGSGRGRRGAGRNSEHNSEPMSRLFINVGKRDRIKPGDILGAIAGESKIAGHVVGSIDMYDNYTFVEVPKSYKAKVLQGMENVTIKGKTVNVEAAKKR